MSWQSEENQEGINLVARGKGLRRLANVGMVLAATPLLIAGTSIVLLATGKIDERTNNLLFGISFAFFFLSLSWRSFFDGRFKKWTKDVDKWRKQR